MTKDSKHKIVAIVPMRHKSERVPGKNYRLFAGLPLYHYIVSTLLSTHCIDKVVIDTDSSFIMEDASRHFPEVSLLERPEHLRAGEISMNQVLLNTVTQVSADFYLQTHSTNPLLQAQTIDKAIRAFLASSTYDSLFSVTRLQTRLWDSKGHPINHDPNVLLRTQDLPPVFEENSNLYIFKKEVLEKSGNRIGKKPMMFEIEPVEAWDIDEEIDFLIAEFLFKQREKKKLGKA
jgi:CMP-N-acetylneuraminic acid synthetase